MSKVVPIERHLLMLSCEVCLRQVAEVEYDGPTAMWDLLSDYPHAEALVPLADNGATKLWFLRLDPMIAATHKPDHWCPPGAVRKAMGLPEYERFD